MAGGGGIVRLNESTPMVMQMRSEGLTYHLIAMELGVTRQRVQQIVDASASSRSSTSRSGRPNAARSGPTAYHRGICGW